MSTHLNPSPFPFSAELNEDQDQHHHLFFSSNLEASSLSCHMFYGSTQDQSGHYHREIQHELQPQQEANNFGWHGGSYDLENGSDNGLDLFLWRKEDRNENHNIENNNSVKWMSSKMRLMKKSDDQLTVIAHKLEDDEKQPISSSSSPTETTTDHNNININIPVRVCADCNTSKTPLWRSGPTGPKSLCNACGIRQRKARRAAMAAAAAANGTILATEASTMKSTSKVVLKNKRSNINGNVARRKKRSKFAIPSDHDHAHAHDHDHGRKKLCFEEFLISLSNNLAFQSVFPQDEKEAAILLMALSCGLVHG